MADRVVEYVVVLGLASRKQQARGRSSSPAIKEGLNCRMVHVHTQSALSNCVDLHVHVHVHVYVAVVAPCFSTRLRTSSYV